MQRFNWKRVVIPATFTLLLAGCGETDPVEEEEAIVEENGGQEEVDDPHEDHTNHDENDHEHHEDHDPHEEMGEVLSREEFEEEAAQLPDSFREEATENLMTLNTKNITRLDSESPERVSILTSQTVWPATHEENQPGAVILAEADDWQRALAVLTLVHHPNDGPLLLMENGLSEEILMEINRLAPLGNDEDIEVVVAGELNETDRKQLADYSIQEIGDLAPPAFANDVDEIYAGMSGSYPMNLVVVSMEEEQAPYSLIAGNWIAHMDEPILFVESDSIPEETREALELRGRNANIYVLQEEGHLSEGVMNELEELGYVTEISGTTPVEASIAFAEFDDELFGWGIDEPGHGVVFANSNTPVLSLASAPFGHLGKHAPLIWIDNEIEESHAEYLAKLKPAFEEVPMEGPYNHAYLIGSKDVLSYTTQGILDDLLEIDALSGDAHGGHH